MTRFTIFRRALTAIVLPLSLLLLARTRFLQWFVELASERLATRWLLSLLVLILIGVECHCLGVFFHLVRARFNAGRFRELQLNPAAAARRMRRRFRLASAGLAVLCALGCAELAFRLLGIEAPFRTVAPDGCFRDVDLTRNEMGIREDWETIAEGDSRIRIAFLGDSFTFGYRVEQTQTFCHLVEGLLADCRSEGVLTINLGEPGTAPGSQLIRFRELRDVLRPDVVVQVLYPNDLGVDLHFLLLNLHRIRNRELWFGRISRVLAFAEVQAHYWILWNQTLGYFRGGRTAGERERSWAHFERDLRACKEAVEEGGSVYGLVLFPWIYRLDQYPLRDVHARIAALATTLDVPFLDLFDTFALYPEESLRTCHRDDHPNPKGHRVAAEQIARFLEDQILRSVPLRSPG